MTSVVALSDIFEKFQGEMSLFKKGENAVESGHIASLKILKGNVFASMKNKRYFVEVSLNILCMEMLVTLVLFFRSTFFKMGKFDFRLVNVPEANIFVITWQLFLSMLIKISAKPILSVNGISPRLFHHSIGYS